MLKGRLRVYVNQAPSPVLVVLRSRPPLDAVPEAYHNPAAVWWGAFASSACMLTALSLACTISLGSLWRCSASTCGLAHLRLFWRADRERP